MKKAYYETKISTIALILMLAMSVIIVVLPNANAQQLIMNVDTEAIFGFPIAVDLNGPTTQLEGLKFAYKPPGATEFILTTDLPIDNEPGLPGERYVTDPGGDCDIEWTPTEIGDYEVKWVLPAQGLESNVVTISVLEKVEQVVYPFLGAVPNPVGVNQEVLLHVGITQQEMRVDYGHEGLTVAVKKPDGTTDTLGPYDTDATGGTGGIFTPTQVGTYELQTKFPSQQMSNGITLLAGESDVLELVVQSDPVPYYPGHSLPDEYWTRPIDAQLRERYKIAGNWLDRPLNLDPPYNEYAPDTAHILWTKPVDTGGVAGGETGEHAFDCGDAYEGKYPNRIISAGRLYYTSGGSRPLAQAAPVITHCVELHTGEELWSKIFLDNRSISFGQHLYWDSFNYHGVFDYLWVTVGSTWYAFDAFTGDWRFTFENVPPGSTIFDSNGGIQRLSVSTSRGEMSLWAMDGWVHALTGSSAGSWGNTVEGQIHNADDLDDCWLWTVNIPTDLSGVVEAVFSGDRVIGASVSSDEISVWGLSLEAGKEGELLFNKSWQRPAGKIQTQFATASVETGVIVFAVKETRNLYVFDIDTGDYLYTTETQPYQDFYTLGESRAIPRAVIATEGKIFSCGVAGVVHCFDAETGQLDWTYEVKDPYNEYLFANNWWANIMFITDGKIYVGHDEHSPIDPKPRGAPFTCLNVEDGSVVWRADGLFRQTQWGGSAIIGDSIIATMDSYDQRLYAIGKGPSKTTVSIKNDVITLGSSALVTGMVTDESPGTKDYALTARFPEGVPAVADVDMSEWMLYVYKQFERPTDVSGVTVKLEAVDPNNQYQNFGTTTSDAYGKYGFAFKPETEGTYMIIATFEGSGAYYGSTTTTYLTVDPAPTPETPITPEEPEPEAPWLTTEIAIILAVVAVAIIAAVGYWALRKRK